jgi:WD40 repeat protein
MAVIGALGVAIGAAAQIVSNQNNERPLWIILIAAGAAVGLPGAVSQSPWWQQRSAVRQEERRRRQQRDRERRSHFVVKGHGMDRPSWDGSFFTGRTNAITRLIEWLNGDMAHRALVVTGQPGSGKSAVLGRLIILADAELRRKDLSIDDHSSLPQVRGTIDYEVYARAKDTTQILSALLEAAGLDLDIDSVDELLLAIPKSGRKLTILIDGLDEAVQPERVALELLRPLLDSNPGIGIRLLIGTRPHLVRKLAVPTEAIIDLDDPEYFHLEDLVEYAQRWLLLTSDPVANSPYRADPILSRQLAEAIAERAGRVFLVAQLTARAFAQDASMFGLSRSSWRGPFPTNVGAAMDAYLTRTGDSDRSRELLMPLAFAEGNGLPPGPLWASLATAMGTSRYSEQDVLRLLSRSPARDLLEPVPLEGGEQHYRLFHEALAEYLRSVVPHPKPERAITTTLINSVPESPDGSRNWFQASEYVREHLPAHAINSGDFEKLVNDAGFLLAGFPDQMLRALSTGGMRSVRRTAAIYRGAVHHLRTAPAYVAASQLELHARQQGHDQLADQVAGLSIERQWSTKWARCRHVHPHQILGRHDDEVNALALVDVDGRSAVVTVDAAGKVRIWDTEKGTELRAPIALPEGEANAVGVLRSGHGVSLVVGGDAGLWMLNLTEPQPQPQRIGPPVGVRAVTVGEGSAGPVIAAGGFDGVIRLWDPSTATAIGESGSAHPGGVQALAPARLNGSPVIVSAGFEGEMAIWDQSTGLEVQRASDSVRQPVAVIDAVTVGDEPTIMAGSLDGAIRVWQPPDGKMREGVFVGSDKWLSCLAMAQVAGQFLVITGNFDGTVRAWDGQDGTLIGGPLAGHENWVTTASAIRRSGRTLVVTGGFDGTVRSWDLTDSDLLTETPNAHAGEVTCLSLVQFEHLRLAVSGGADGTLRIWDTATGVPMIDPIAAHDQGVRSVLATGVGGRLIIISGGLDGDVRIWESEGMGDCEGTFAMRHAVSAEGTVRVLALTAAEDEVIAISAGDGGIRRWDLATGEPAGTPVDTDRQVRALAVTTIHGRPVILAGGDGGIRRWDLATGEPAGTPVDTDRQVRALAIAAIDRQPAIITGDDRGLFLHMPQRQDTDFRIELGFAANCLAVESPGDIIVGTFHGLFRLHTGLGQWLEAGK